MNNYYNLLNQVLLFGEMGQTQIEDLLGCMGAVIKRYRKNDIVLFAGDNVSSIGILLSGSVQIIKEDFNGNRNILTELSPGGIFAETFVCAGITESPVTVLATADCEILYLSFERIITTCPNSCKFHTKLIQNMLKLIARKNITLNGKIDLLSRRSIRDKLTAFFTTQVEKNGKKQFHIPFTRNELADFLCVDRSALSRELCKMRDEGILSFYKNEITLLE